MTGIQVKGSSVQAGIGSAVTQLDELQLPTTLLAALGVTEVAYSDNVVTARAFAARRREAIDSDQEFLALGAANVAAALSHGFPVSSSGSRTALGVAVGSRTQLYSLVAMVVVLAASAAALPTAVDAYRRWYTERHGSPPDTPRVRGRQPPNCRLPPTAPAREA